MPNSTDLSYKRDNFILQFLDCGCVSISENCTEQDIRDCDEAISEYECLLQYAIDRRDKDEIRQLRSNIQHTKAEKRNIKRMMKNRMEPALT